MNRNSEKILEILNEGAAAYTFPVLDNGYVYLAAPRLSLSRDFNLVASWVVDRAGRVCTAFFQNLCATLRASQP